MQGGSEIPIDTSDRILRACGSFKVKPFFLAIAVYACGHRSQVCRPLIISLEPLHVVFIMPFVWSSCSSCGHHALRVIPRAFPRDALLYTVIQRLNEQLKLRPVSDATMSAFGSVHPSLSLPPGTAASVQGCVWSPDRSGALALEVVLA